MSEELPGVARVDYSGEGLDESRLAATPWQQLQTWMAEAVAHSAAQGGQVEPDVLMVATVDEDGLPDVRPVLMKFFAPSGPGFIADSGSVKARQLAASPKVAAAIRWDRLYRVVRFRGEAQPLSTAELEGYWRTRPWGSQVAAWASHQSAPISGREELERRYGETAARFTREGERLEVPMPESFCGWRIRPVRVELWAGRPSRLHDRIAYDRVGDGDLDDAGSWSRARLMP